MSDLLKKTSNLLICPQQPERIAHICSFVLRDLSEWANERWANDHWANERWANEWIPYPAKKVKSATIRGLWLVSRHYYPRLDFFERGILGRLFSESDPWIKLLLTLISRALEKNLQLLFKMILHHDALS